MRTMGAPRQDHPPAPRRSPDDEPPHRRILDGLARLWSSERPGVALARDAVLVLFVIGVLLGGLWIYSGQSLDQPPVVVVESGSMMHPDAPYGRIGTIDPGDLVLVKDVREPGTIATAYDGDGASAYGGHGEVVVFRPMGDNARTPIIHRAITWVEVTQDGDGDPRYQYRNHAGETITGARSVDLPEVGIVGMQPPTSGFVTKGDNPRTNHAADQLNHIPDRLVEPDWIIGTAKGQAPWIGLIKLSLTGTPTPLDTTGQWQVLRAWAPSDTWTMLLISAGTLLIVPFGLETLWKHNASLRRWTS